MGHLAQFVQMFDVFEGEVVEKVVLALYETKPELVEALDLGGSLCVPLRTSSS